MEQTTTYQLIERIEELRLDQFIDCICDQKLQVLILSGEPSAADLLECWSNLYAQYLDILDDSETLYIIQLQKEVGLLQHKILLAEAIIKVLRFMHVEQLVQDLKELGFPIVNLKQGHSGYEHALKRIEGRLAPLRLKLQGKEEELTEYYRDKQEGAISRQFFIRQLSRLSKYQGYPIRPRDTMVPEYVAILKDYLTQNTKTNTDGEEG
jgi:hypothetical protein